LLKIPHGHYKNVRFDIDDVVVDNYSGYSFLTITAIALFLGCSTPTLYDLGGGFNIVIQVSGDLPETCNYKGINLYVVINEDTDFYYLFDSNFAITEMLQDEPTLYTALQTQTPGDPLGTFYSTIINN
jgi:hypothetical protein